MVAFARGLLLLLVVSAALVLAVDSLQPADERGDHSVRLVVGVVASIALVQIGAAILRRRYEVLGRTTPLWRPALDPRTRREPPAISELEALIISATTGGARARDRLDRRLAAVGCETLAERLSVADPTPQQVTDAIDQILASRLSSTEGSHVL